MQIAYLWGNPQIANGSFIKLPAGFKGAIESQNELKAVVVSGTHQWNNDINTKTPLLPGSVFRSKAKGEHRINVETELVLYINSNGRYNVE